MTGRSVGYRAPPGGQAPEKKGERPVAGTTKRSGFRACAKNDCKNIIPRSRRIASPSFAGEGVTRP